MNKLFKKIIPALVLFSMLFTATFTANAATSSSMKTYTEAQLNKILLKAGYPSNQLSDISFETKNTIVQTSGESLIFSGTKVEKYSLNKSTGELAQISPMTISTSDLMLKIDCFKTYCSGGSNGAGYYLDVYPQFKWYTPNNTQINDKISFSLPQGWVLESGSYSGKTYEQFASTTNPNPNPVFDQKTFTSPYDIDFAAVCWDNMTGMSSLNNCSWCFSGTFHARAYKKDSSAPNRVIGKYVHDSSSSGSGVSVGVTLGWLSINYTFPSGSTKIDQLPCDLNFSY